MATFDPITYTAVTKLKDPVGALRLVPENFTSTDYVEVGKTFDTALYPDLDPMAISVKNPADIGSRSIPTIPSHRNSSISAMLTEPVFVDEFTGLMIELPGNMGSSLPTQIPALRTTNGGDTWETIDISFDRALKVSDLQAGNGYFRLLGLTTSGSTSQFDYLTLSNRSPFIPVIGDSTDGVNWTWTQYSENNGFNNKFTFDNVSGSYVRGPILLGFLAQNSNSQQSVYAQWYRLPLGSSTTTGYSLPLNHYTSYVAPLANSSSYSAAAGGNNGVLVVAKARKVMSQFYSFEYNVTFDVSLPTSLTTAWTDTSPTTEKLRMFTSSSRSVMFASGTGYCYVSFDKGISWIDYKTPFTVTNSNTIAISDEWIVVASTFDNGIWKSRTGEDWYYEKLNGPTQGLTVSFHNGKFYYSGQSATEGNMYVSTDTVYKMIPMINPPQRNTKWVVKGKN